ncbi:MAG: transcriptional regulator [Gammaproteobacteria bacterium]
MASISEYLAGDEFADFHRLINERVRLGILSVLAVNSSASFSELKALLEATDGNLSAHARRLEDAGLVSCRKTFKGRKPHTEFQLTAKGRTSLERYLSHMETLIAAMRNEQ